MRLIRGRMGQRPLRFIAARFFHLGGSMAITLVSYTYVEPGGAPPQMRERATSSGVRSFLDAHVDALTGKATAGSLSPAVFRSADGRTRLGRLATGTKGQFLASSRDLADRLYSRMDHRAKRGFFVTVRRTGPALGAALKLDVRDAAAAALQMDAAGEPSLEAVQNLLDIPGELQKGAVVPDGRPDSEVTVGDKLAVTSLYFLEALDVQQHIAPGPATADFLRVVQEVAPRKVAAAAAAVEGETRISLTDFFDRHADVLSEDEQEEVLDRARVRRRPIEIIDPESYALREEIEADGIVIRGRSSTIREKLRISDRPGGYRIEIDFDEQPRRRYI